MIAATQTQGGMQKEKWHKHAQSLTLALQELTQLRTASNTIRRESTQQMQAIFTEINNYKAELEARREPVQTEMDRATELAKLEAFDCWIEGKPSTQERSQPRPCWTGS